MAAEGDPTDMIKVLHLLVMAFTWGMQMWVSLIAGLVMLCTVTRHTFGSVQIKLIPVFCYCLLGSTTVSLAIYVVYHPRQRLNWHEGIQMTLFFVTVILAGLNAQWFTPAVVKYFSAKKKIEQEHGLGGEIGFFINKERYAKLHEQDPKYKTVNSRFFLYHGLSNLINFVILACTTVNLIYLALNLSFI